MIRPSLGLVALLALTLGCPAEEDPPSRWEIIQGTAVLTGSAAVVPDTRAPIVSYENRTGELVIGTDSTVTGWIKLSAGDTAHVTGVVVVDGADLVMTLTDLTPTEYTIFTNGSFPTTYGLVSTAILNSDVTGDGNPEQHRIYWEFER
jgi:hypothetical protein